MRNIMKRTAPLFVLALMALGTARNAQAVGTAADTPITNTASMTYTVGGVVQIPPPPASAILIVDRKINVVVSHMDGNYVTVTPGKMTAVLNFKVQNIGNSEMRFILSAINLPVGSATAFTGLSNKTTPALAAYAEHTRIPMLYQAGSDTPVTATLGTTSETDYTYAYVIVDIPTAISSTSVINGDTFAFALKARAVFEDGTTVITQDIQDSAFHYSASHNLWNVLADGHDTWNDDIDFDGSAVDRSAFIVTASVLAMSKSYLTFSDPINGTTNPKNIPGAVVEYIITITNNGAVAADNVIINDALTASTTLQATPYGAGFNCAQMSQNGGTTWIVVPSLTCSGDIIIANLGTIPIGSVDSTAYKLKYRAIIR